MTGLLNNDMFFSNELKQRFQLLSHLISNSAVIPLVRSAKGTGKSMMARSLALSAPADWQICRIESQPDFLAAPLLQYISRWFGCIVQDSDPMSRLIECLAEKRATGLIPVLLVDDVQLLPTVSLIALLRLHEQRYQEIPLISLALFADERIDDLLALPQLRIMSPQSIRAIDLPRISEVDAAGYMQHVLLQEGLEPELGLEESLLVSLCRETKGIPGDLSKAILDEVGLRAVQNVVSHETTTRLPISILWLVVVPILGILLYRYEITSYFVSRSPDPVQLIEEQLRFEPVSEKPHETLVDGVTPSTASEEDRKPLDAVTDNKKKPDDIMQASSLQVELQPGEDIKQVLSGTIDEGGRRQKLDPHEEQRVDEGDTYKIGTAEGVKAGDAAKVHSQKTTEETPVLFPSEQTRETLTSSQMGEKPAQPDGVNWMGSDWVLSRPRTSYTLQLTSFSNPDGLMCFLQANEERRKLFYLETEYQGKPLYQVFLGEFPDRQSALAARQSLTEIDNSGDSWPRSFGALQKQLEK